jgi:uncharacterized membrane protein YGL010W
MSLLSSYIFYGEYHSNDTNKKIHYVFVPSIVGSLAVLLARVKVADVLNQVSSLNSLIKYVPSLPASIVGHGVGASQPSIAFVLTAGYASYYLYLCSRAKLLSVGVTAAALMMLTWAGAEKITSTYGAAVIVPAVTIQILSWAAQIYGHQVHEKRSPAFMDNISQALVMAPLFVYMEILRDFGYLKAFHDQAEVEIVKRIDAFKAGKSKKL